MEFPTLGRNCSNKDCKQLDFLPLQCQCLEYFCKEHFTEHCLNECKSAPTPAAVITSDSFIYTCEHNGCNKSSFLKLPCPKCGLHYCIGHRFHESCPEIDPLELAQEKERWAAPKRQYQAAKENVDKLIAENFRRLLESSKKTKTAMKIQLMYLKSKASGPKSIPTTDRIYFSVSKPSSYDVKKLHIDEETCHADLNQTIDPKAGSPVFISKTWSVGRCIDAICESCHIKNENNKPATPKVRLFRKLDKYCISPKKLDVKLSDLLKGQVLVDGDSILLEYVSEEDLLLMDENSQAFLEG